MLFLAAALVLGTAGAQDEASETLTALELSIVLSRQSEDGDPTRAPYTLHLLAGRVHRAELRVGRELPVAVAGGDGESSGRFQYRNVGVNLSCRAFPLEEDRFRVVLSLERSSIAGNAEPPDHLPSFQTFSSESELVLGDGETGEAVAGTDPATGERWTVEVTLRRRP